MSTFDDWERWLHLGGVSDLDDIDDLDDLDAGNDRVTHADHAHGALRVEVAAVDDPWGALDVALTPLTEAQREHLRLAAPTVLDELIELERRDGADDEAHGTEAGASASGELSVELTTAFKALDTIEPHVDDDQR